MTSKSHTPGSLNAAQRERDLAALADGEVVDLLVVGLGVTGAGVALDAAARGLTVAAIDAHDLAHGTSRWSSKLVHGGLRYLAHGQVGIAHESAVERGILMQRTAPHLIRPLPFLLPLTETMTGRDTALSRAGFLAGDALRASARTSRRTLPRSKRISAEAALALVPGLRGAGLRGALQSWDGQLSDDVRLVVALARTAAARGARIVTRCQADLLTADGAEAVDTLTGTRLAIRARAVVSATGVWAGTLSPQIRLRPSRGSHIVLRSSALGGVAAAVTVPVPGEFGRYVFTLPQSDGRVYVGLTDEPVGDGPIPGEPVPSEAEIAFLLEVAGSVFERPPSRTDVVGAYAGLRPLLDAGPGKTADLSRRHAVLTSPEGVVTVVGGKLTTYRQMAEDAVDAAVLARHLTAGPCVTRELALVGAAPRSALPGIGAPERLVWRYGTEAPAVLASADQALHEPVAPGLEVTGAELLWAVRHEGALDESDLLDRRTRVGLVPADRAAALQTARAVLASP